MSKAAKIYFSFFFIFCVLHSGAQKYVFASLTGSPVNTTGWNITGAAYTGNVTGTGDSEIMVCPSQPWNTGAIFYQQPINISLCNKWTAEFDFRIFDGNSADGLAFCFLDVPPTGFVAGGGLGIPSTANGLKICFDTFNNCPPYDSTQSPKIEIRSGTGYDECWLQPTRINTNGDLNFIRSDNYNHATITYVNGNISVYVNGALYLTDYEIFNFAGYLGFTASTGAITDNHSIKNVFIYTNVPESEAGNNQTICPGQLVQIGTTSDSSNVYNWIPGTGLNSAVIANPFVTGANATADTVIQKYFVQTSYASSAGCYSVDSIQITVLPSPQVSVSINTSASSVCKDSNLTFVAVPVNGGSAPFYQWQVDGINAGTNNPTFNITKLANGDVVSCLLTSNATCAPASATSSNSIAITINPTITPSVTINSSVNSTCVGVPVTFNAIPFNGGTIPFYQWKKNGVNTGADSTVYSSNTLANGDIISCELTSNAGCLSVDTATSNSIVMVLTPPVVAAITISTTSPGICSGSAVTFTAAVENGGLAPVFQWKKNGENTGTNSSTYTTTELADKDIVSCELSNDAACPQGGPLESNAIVMSVSTVLMPSVSISASTINVCPGSPVTFTAAALGAGASPSYQWKNNGINAGANSNTYTDNFFSDSDQVYCLLTAVNKYCPDTTVSSNPVNISVSNLPVISITPGDTIVKPGTQVQLTAIITGDIKNYEWSPAANFINAFTLTPVTVPLEASANYILKVSTGDGCLIDAEITIKVYRKFAMPNAFTPNNDGLNDVFRIPPDVKLTLNNFSIYNRWGEKIFFTRDIAKGWDGTLNGKKVPPGTFVYVINAVDDDGPVFLKGTFVLIR